MPCTAADRRSRARRGAGEQDVVVGDDLEGPGAARRVAPRRRARLCQSAQATPARRELDNTVLERAAFVCCDSIKAVRRESGRPDPSPSTAASSTGSRCTSSGDVAGELQGRASPEDIVLFKSNGIAAQDLAVGARVVELARERGVGRELA